jgi:NNP family nitrate/nitrite transporter-like MFS transporter
MAEEVKYPRYRWFLLVLGWGILTLTAYNHTMLNVRYDLLLPVVQGGLGLTKTQFYLCITSTALAAIPLALISGFLTDKVGVRRVILYGAIVTAIGALLRLAATGFVDLFIYSAIMGVGLGTVGGNVPKLVGQWFPVRQIYLGIALFTTALGIGPFLALATGALFPSFFMAFLVMGVLLLVGCGAWAIWAKDRPKEFLEDGRMIVDVPYRESFLTVFKNKYVWLISGSYCLVAAVVASWVGGLPLLLVRTKEVSGATAGLVTSLSVVGYIIGIVLWAWLAEKVGRMKPVYCICMALSGTTGLLVYILAPGVGMWVLGILPGLFMGAGYPLIMQMPLRLPGIGIRYAGTAMGLITASGAVISFVMLPYMFTPIWDGVGAIYATVFLCASLWIAGALFIVAPEVGRKYLMRVLQEAQQAGATAS